MGVNVLFVAQSSNSGSALQPHYHMTCSVRRRCRQVVSLPTPPSGRDQGARAPQEIRKTGDLE